MSIVKDNTNVLTDTKERLVRKLHNLSSAEFTHFRNLEVSLGSHRHYDYGWTCSEIEAGQK